VWDPKSLDLYGILYTYGNSTDLYWSYPAKTVEAKSKFDMAKTIEMMREMKIDKDIEVENVRINTLRRALLMRL
jgi:hypothetical protein